MFFSSRPTKKRKLMSMKNNHIINDDKSDEDNEINIETINNNIYFYSDVTTKSAFQLIKELKNLDLKLQTEKIKNDLKNVNINLHIHSYGGDLYGAFAVIDIIRTLNTPVHSYIEGIAASAATIISVVCEKRYIYKNSYMLIHQLSSGMWGKFADLEDEMINCEEFMKVIKDIYKKYTKVNKRKLEDILKHDLWWNAEICLENNLVDEIL